MEKRNRKRAERMSRTIRRGESAEGETGEEAAVVAVGSASWTMVDVEVMVMVMVMVMLTLMLR